MQIQNQNFRGQAQAHKKIDKSFAQDLRNRVLNLSDRVQLEDGGPLDRNPAARRVRLEEVSLPVGGESLKQARAAFDGDGFVQMQLNSHHQQGMGGEFRVRARRQGDREIYHLAQDGYHGSHAFRADLEYDRKGAVFTRADIRPGPPQGMEALREVLTSPGELALVGGIGVLGGLLGGAMIGGGATTMVASCSLGVGMMLVAAVATKQEG